MKDSHLECHGDYVCTKRREACPSGRCTVSSAGRRACGRCAGTAACRDMELTGPGTWEVECAGGYEGVSGRGADVGDFNRGQGNVYYSAKYDIV